MKKFLLFFSFILFSALGVVGYFVFQKYKTQDENNYQYLQTLTTSVIGKSIIHHPEHLLIENIGKTNQPVEQFITNIKPQTFDTFLVFISYNNEIYSINVGLAEYQKINLHQTINVDLFQTPIFKNKIFFENPDNSIFKQEDKGYMWIPFKSL